MWIQFPTTYITTIVSRQWGKWGPRIMMMWWWTPDLAGVFVYTLCLFAIWLIKGWWHYLFGHPFLAVHEHICYIRCRGKSKVWWWLPGKIFGLIMALIVLSDAFHGFYCYYYYLLGYWPTQGQLDDHNNSLFDQPLPSSPWSTTTSSTLVISNMYWILLLFTGIGHNAI